MDIFRKWDFFGSKIFWCNRNNCWRNSFYTSLTGYQEIISDPSYAGQFITFTMPEIGNVGVNDDDMESRKCHCKGVLVRNYHDEYSNYRAQGILILY